MLHLSPRGTGRTDFPYPAPLISRFTFSCLIYTFRWTILGFGKTKCFKLEIEHEHLHRNKTFLLLHRSKSSSTLLLRFLQMPPVSFINWLRAPRSTGLPWFPALTGLSNNFGKSRLTRLEPNTKRYLKKFIFGERIAFHMSMLFLVFLVISAVTFLLVSVLSYWFPSFMPFQGIPKDRCCITGFHHLNEKETLQSWTVMETLIAVSGLALTLVTSLII